MNDLKNIKWPDWLDPCRESLVQSLGRGHMPQALLIHGLPGTGRSRLAYWLAGRLLGLPDDSLAPYVPDPEADPDEEALAHPDLLVASPPPEKATIPIEAVRDLIGFLQLTSHQGGGRVVIIVPAEAMTPGAANSLLKTLEEPPAGSAIILVTSALSRLPATIVSRCQRLRVPVPAREVALRWLATVGGSADWEPMLDFAGGAPLLALAWHRAGLSKRLAQYGTDLDSILRQRASAAEVARRWAAEKTPHAARWLYLRASAELRAAAASSGINGPVGHLKMAAKPTNMLLQRLRTCEELCRNASRALNAEAQLAAVLQHWYGHGQTEGGKR